jgi:hypothetical protein
MSRTLLLHSADASQAATEITRLGGRVTHQFNAHLFVAQVDHAFDEASMTLATTIIPDALDEQSALLVRAWRTASANAKHVSQPDKVLKWDELGLTASPNHHSATLTNTLYRPEIAPPVSWKPIVTSQQLTGSITVGLIVVMGPDALGFNSDEQDNAVVIAMMGLNFLANLQPAANITFVYSIRFVQINAIPTSDICTDKYRCEILWRDPVLKQLGYMEQQAGVVEMIKVLRTQNKTKWAFVAFISKYPTNDIAYAYHTLGYFCMKYEIRTDLPNLLNSRFAHETCHLFGAQDEYTSSGCNCNTTAGIDSVFNGNCANGVVAEPCLMNNTTLELCTFTRGQLGWWPRSGISVMHQSAKDFDSLLKSVFDGEKWWTAEKVPRTHLVGSPGATLFNNKQYIFHQGAMNGNPTEALWYSVYDGHTWQKEKMVPNTDTGGTPSPVQFQDKLYVFHRGHQVSNQLWYNVYDEATDTWEGDVRLPSVGITESPSAVVYNGQLYVFYQGMNGEGIGHLSYIVYNGSSWVDNPQSLPVNALMSNSPSAVVNYGGLRVFFQGPRDNGMLNYVYHDGNRWDGAYEVHKVSMSGSPSAVYFFNYLYVFYKDLHSKNALYFKRQSSTGWLRYVEKALDEDVAGSPSAVAFSFAAP